MHQPLVNQESESSQPPAKRTKVDGKMDKFVAKGLKQDEFLKDVVKAFGSSNIPLSKLAVGSPMRQLFDKYMRVDGEALVSSHRI